MISKIVMSTIAIATTLMFTISTGHAQNNKNKDKDKDNKGRNSEKIGICHLEADGSYTLLNLKTRPALNHLEKHSFGGEGDRLANEDGNCDFDVIETPDCPCFEQGGPWSDTWPDVPAEFTVPEMAASGLYYLTDNSPFTDPAYTRIDFISSTLLDLFDGNETMAIRSSTIIASGRLTSPNYFCQYYTTTKQDLSGVVSMSPAETIEVCRTELYELFGQTAPPLQQQ